ncbi:MAG: type II toxin-antitoxin system RelE/ParE family toxin [Nitrosomonadales bacterium]|nr:type II toxin-antitoxin system RelE/ParE family toxin [Nitrosomonadales bacterium]
MAYTITYYSEALQMEIMSLPDTLQARYIGLTARMIEHGANLGEPHTKAFGDGLFELRLKGAEGIARVFYCTLVGRQIVMLHCFIKKSQKTPLKEHRIAKKRMMEVKQ